MSLKLKGLGLAVLASLAIGAVTVMTASATTGGHFVSDAVDGHTIVNQTSGEGIHNLSFVQHGLESAIVCDEMSVTGTATTATVTSGVGTPTFAKCHTEGSETSIAIHMNGCQTQITVAAGEGATEQTNDIICPPEKQIIITHPNCTITIVPQTVTGITYTRIVDNGKHAITAAVNSQVALQYHAGICIFTGTNHTGTFKGSTIIRAFDTAGEQVNVTAT